MIVLVDALSSQMMVLGKKSVIPNDDVVDIL